MAYPQHLINSHQKRVREKKINIKITDQVPGQLGCNVADLLADGWGGLLLDARQQLCLDGCLHLHGQAWVDLLKRGRQQPPQQHCCHLFDLWGQKKLLNTMLLST